MPPYQNYRLGQEGVNVDGGDLINDPFSLSKAQNAIRDPLGADGGLKKRPGLTKFNANAAAGSLLGGVSAPLSGFVDTRTLILAQQDGSSVEKWYESSDLFATSGVANSLIGAWQDPTAYFSGAAGLCRMGAFSGGRLYYASASYTSGTTSPLIYAWNGSEDREFSRLLPATTLGITGIFAVKGTVYILTLDSGTTDADFVGRVFSMSQISGHLTQIGNAITTGHVPVSLAVHNGLIFVGTARVTTTNEAAVLRINPVDETAWTTDLSASADDYAITSLTSFRGLLYATTKNGGGATKGKVLQRALAGTWSTVDSTVNNSGTYDGSAVFGGALYVSSRSYSTTTSTAVIRKSTDGSSWSTVTNSSSTDGFGHLVVIGLRLFSQFGTKIQHTTSGSSWTLATPGGGGNVDGALGVLLVGGEPEFSDPTTATDVAGDDPTQTTTTTTTTTTNTLVIGPANVSQTMLVFQQTMTHAQMLALSSTPITLASGIAGYALVPAYITFAADIATSISGSHTINLRYTGSTTALVSFSFTPTTATGLFVKFRDNSVDISVANAVSTYGITPYGKDIEIFASASTLSGGSLTSNTLWKIAVYCIMVPTATA